MTFVVQPLSAEVFKPPRLILFAPASRLRSATIKKTAESSRTPPFLLEHSYLRTKVGPHGNCIGASIRWTRSRAWQ